MPVSPTYPGVYIEEVSSGVRSIAGVATSIAAFVDTFASGPLNEAVEIFDMGDFERKLGGLAANSEASYQIAQFFLNGGAQAYAVRVTSATAGNAALAAGVVLHESGTGTSLLTATAASPGAWGNNVRLDVDYDTSDPATTFNLRVTKVATVNGVTSPVATETFRNLVIDPSKPNDAAAVVNAGSRLITLAATAGSTAKRPAQTGTSSSPVTAAALAALASGEKLSVALGTSTPLGETSGLPGVPTSASQLAATLQAQIRALVPNATVTVVGTSSAAPYLVAKTGTATPSDVLALANGSTGTLHTQLGLDENVQQYALGGATIARQGSAQSGSDGTWDPATDAGIVTSLLGNQSLKTGMYALLDADVFNILCIPATTNLPETGAAQVSAQAIALCKTRRAVHVVDPPAGHDTPQTIQAWLTAHPELRDRNAATYFPRVDFADALNGFRLRAGPNSGSVAGVYARTDAERGVWKAPAGIGASLAGVQKLEYKLTDPENGVLNPLAINAIRNFPVYGNVVWGARTLYGADQLVDDYKYLPVRRLALYVEESLYRGTQWVVFEPNDAPLWSQIRLNVGAFMHTLFRQGAFAGTTPADAYFVHCDDKTNPQADINLGIVNVVVGFAPLKPAEFVVIKIQQIAGQIES
jgi:phage tail sheath protein FI